MTEITDFSRVRVRLTTPLKARHVDTGEFVWFPKGALLWHVEVGEDLARFQEIGGSGIYEAPQDEFTQRVKRIAR